MMIDEKQELVYELNMLYTETEISNVKIETMRERGREEDAGYYDQFEYMQEYIWPDEGKLKKRI